MDELRHAMRRLLKRPASTFASIATLACATAAAAVTWSTLSAVLLDPLPIRDPRGLFVVANERQARSGPIVSTGFVYPVFQQVRESGVFEGTIGQWSGTHLLLVSTGGMPVRTDVAFVTHDYFDVLGVRVVLGREFLPDDDRRGAAPVAVLTDRYWRHTFAADPAALGRTIEVAGSPVTIAGVLEPRFRGLNLAEKPDVYLAFHTIADIAGRETNYFAEPGTGTSPTAGMVILGRLPSPSSPVAAAERIAALEPFGRIRQGPRVLVMPATAAAVPAVARHTMERFSRLLAATVVLLLLIGCATVGMLLLIRTDARRAEFATCMALGASRARLARGIALEGSLLAAGGSLLALPVASSLFRLIGSFELPGRISIELLELTLDGRTLAACTAAAVLAVGLIALVAGVFGFRAELADALRSRAGASARTAGRTTRNALVASQVAVALTLAVGAGLFARSLIAALNLNTALDMSRIVIGTVQLRPYGYSGDRASAFFETLRGRIGAHPAVESLALSRWEGGMSPNGRILVDGTAMQVPSLLHYIRIDERYFTTMGIRLIEGRNFSPSDRAGAPPVAIASESFARLVANGGSPLGRRLSGFSAAGAPLEVVGVASDVITNVTVMEPLVIYLADAQGAAASIRDLTVRATDVPEVMRHVSAVIRDIDPQVTSTTLRTLEERILEQMGPQRLGGTVLGTLGGIAVLLTLLGAYVLADSMATTRMREMGIRAALGATRRQLGAVILRDTTRLVVFGLAGGLVLTWLATGTIRAFLFKVQPLDPVTLGGVAAAILLLTLAVSSRAALRVARVDLAHVLRNE